MYLFAPVPSNPTLPGGTAEAGPSVKSVVTSAWRISAGSQVAPDSISCASAWTAAHDSPASCGMKTPCFCW